jgi:hypothetical protein
MIETSSLLFLRFAESRHHPVTLRILNEFVTDLLLHNWKKLSSIWNFREHSWIGGYSPRIFVTDTRKFKGRCEVILGLCSSSIIKLSQSEWNAFFVPDFVPIRQGKFQQLSPLHCQGSAFSDNIRYKLFWSWSVSFDDQKCFKFIWIIDDFLDSYRDSFPEDRPIEDVKLNEIANSEVINDMSWDAGPVQEKQRLFRSAGIFSTEKIVEAKQDRLFHAWGTTLVKYSDESILNQRIRLPIDFKVEDFQDFRSDKIVWNG